MYGEELMKRVSLLWVAVGIVTVDEVAGAHALETAAEAIRKVPAIRSVWIVRLGVT